MEIYLVRHGFSQSNAGDNSSLDPALTALGFTQAEYLGNRLAQVPFSAVLVSPLLRTVQTALPTAKKQGAPLQLCFELMEVDTDPAWQFAGVDALINTVDYPEISVFSSGYTPCPEDDGARRDRADAVMRLIKERFGSEDKVLLVTHGTYLRYLMMAALEMPRDFQMRFTMTNACVNRVIWSEKEPPRLALMNDTRHLPFDCLSKCGKADIFG